MSATSRSRRPRTTRQRAARSRALNAIADLRRGEAHSLSEAARQRGTTVRTIRRYTPSAIERPANSRRWRARRGDTYGSVMAVIVADRQRPERILEVRGSRNRSLVARHRIAISRFLAGEELDLEDFAGVTIRGKVVEPGIPDDGEIVELDLLTDPDDIQAHGELNQLTDEGPLRAAMSTSPRDTECIICGKPGSVHSHHVAGATNLPTVFVAVCSSRHAAWHRRLRAGAVDLCAGTARAWADAVLRGFLVIFEDAAAVDNDPRASRAGMRRQSEQRLALLEAFLPRPTAREIAAAPIPRGSSSSRPPGERARECQPRRPRDGIERQLRAVAFVRWLLLALAGLLETLLPAELQAHDLPARLRHIDPDRLARAALEPTGETAESDRAWRSSVQGIGSRPSPSLNALGNCLDLCVSSFEAMASRETADGD